MVAARETVPGSSYRRRTIERILSEGGCYGVKPLDAYYPKGRPAAVEHRESLAAPHAPDDLGKPETELFCVDDLFHGTQVYLELTLRGNPGGRSLSPLLTGGQGKALPGMPATALRRRWAWRFSPKSVARRF